MHGLRKKKTKTKPSFVEKSAVGGNFGNKIPKLMPPRVTSTVSLRFRERSRPVSLCCIAVLILVIIGKILSTRLGKKERKKKRNPIFRLMNSGFFAEDEINDFFSTKII